MVKNCDLGLENAALGLRPRAVFSRPRSQFSTIRTSQPANNIYLCISLIGRWMNARHSWNYHQLSWPFERGLSLLDSNFHGLVVDIPPSISSMFENNSTAAPGWLQFILLSYFGKWVFNHLNNGYTMLFGPFGARPDIKANIPSCCRKNGCF